MIQLGYSVKFVMAQGLINDYVAMTEIPQVPFQAEGNEV
jgi:hypothetical protein